MYWNLIIDVALCESCSNCVLATKDELVGNDFPGYSAPHPAQGAGVMRIERHLRGSGHHVQATHVPVTCNHCADAPCVQAGGGAVTQRDDGIVIVDAQRAHGRRDLVDACPYGAMIWNEERQLPQNWFFDAHLLDAGWAAPRCVGVCPTRAIEAVKLDDAAMQARVREQGLQVLRPELGTRPRVHYRHLERLSDCYVAGSVVRRDAQGRLECADGAEVELLHDGAGVARTRTDAFGDFRFAALGRGGGAWRVAVTLARHRRAERDFDLELPGLVLDEIELEAG